MDADFGYEDDEEAMNQAMKDMEDEFGDEDEWDESIKIINGKKYKEVKEEKKITEKHILRENYERFGGK